MGLIRLGALWEKAFKNGNGFAGQLDAEEVENILNADPQVDKIRVLVFDNAKGLEKNESAPHYVIYAPDGEDDARDGGGGARGAQSSQREPEPEPAQEPSNPLDAPPPAAPVRRRSAAPARTQAPPPPAPARGNGRRSTGGAGKRGYGTRRSGRK